MISVVKKGSYKGRDYVVYDFAAGKYSMTVTNVGCAIMKLNVPGGDGKCADVVLGYDTVEEYIDNRSFFGAVIGRVGNRIKNSTFALDGKSYKVVPTSADNTSLHGGTEGFDTKAFASQIGLYDGREALIFYYTSPDGEQGYPGTLTLRVVYSLCECGDLLINYSAVTDKPTVCNITNHSFFNLGGHDSGTILDNTVKINAKFYTPYDKNLNTTGDIAPVKGTALDFTKAHVVGERIDADEKPLKLGGGYDHNYVINVKTPGSLTEAAEVTDPRSGRTMKVLTDCCAIQLYTGNFLAGERGKGGAIYAKRSALCLETQYFPGCVTYAHFPSCRLDPGQEYNHTTIYRFGTL